MKVAKIILSEQAIPDSKNGSWTQRMEYFLSHSNSIDFYICNPSNLDIKSETKFINANSKENKLANKIWKHFKFQNFIKELDIISKQYDKIIICIVDNIKLNLAVSNYIDNNNLKDKITVLFYNCGYSYFLDQAAHQKFCKNLDEIVFLTKEAYLFNKNLYSEFVPEVTIVNNPINKNIFNPLPIEQKESLRLEQNLSGKTIFLWLSHDRPKKGLSIVLNAWKQWSKDKNNVVLLVVGVEKRLEIKNVFFIGKVPSDKVSLYYKIADVYLFSTLCNEGFPLSLAQAVCTGCFVVASDNGGVVSFFKPEYGILLSTPNISQHWVDCLDNSYRAVKNGWVPSEESIDVLDFEEWAVQFSAIFQKWENRIKI